MGKARNVTCHTGFEHETERKTMKKLVRAIQSPESTTTFLGLQKEYTVRETVEKVCEKSPYGKRWKRYVKSLHAALTAFLQT